MTKPERARDGRFVQKHTEYDKTRFITVEARHMRVGMVFETTSWGCCRVAEVVTGGWNVIHIRFTKPDNTTAMTSRGLTDAMVVDSEDLPTALILALKEFPWEPMGFNRHKPPA